MNRREFIHHLALLAASSAALPAQIEAFERAYTLNAPAGVQTGLIYIDDIHIGGMMQSRSTPTVFRFYSGEKQQLELAVNLLGGMVRWAAAPQHAIALTTLKDFRWEVETAKIHPALDVAVENALYAGCIRYIDQEGIWRMVQFNSEQSGTTLETLAIEVDYLESPGG